MRKLRPRAGEQCQNATPALSGIIVEKKYTCLDVNADPSQVASHWLLDLSLIIYLRPLFLHLGMKNSFAPQLL